MSEDLLFGDQDTATPDLASPSGGKPWTVVMVDDEDEVHQVTRLVLSGFEFDGRPVNFISAHSLKEAKELLPTLNDVALILIDVVMETDDAGLQLVQFIRNEMGNQLSRLVLRTGQPGQAPEESVIAQYDIDDYKNKTELTSSKLKTLMYAGLRAYRDIKIIDNSREGLEHVVSSTGKIFESTNLRIFASAVLEQIRDLLVLGDECLYITNNRFDGVSTLYTDLKSKGTPEYLQHYEILAATGEIADYITENGEDILPDHVVQNINEVMEERESKFFNRTFVGYYKTRNGQENILYVSPNRPLTDLDISMLNLFSTNIAIAFEHLRTKDEIAETQQELVYILSNAIERRSSKTLSSVKRVASIAEVVGGLIGLGKVELEQLKLAACLHDIGKVGVPYSVLSKKGSLSDDEFGEMRTHPIIGHEILSKSKKVILQMGAEIALHHHENWDGSGYPNGLKGEDISLMARITAIADSIDAILSRHEGGMDSIDPDDLLENISKLSGKRYDPKLVSVLLDNKDLVIKCLIACEKGDLE